MKLLFTTTPSCVARSPAVSSNKPSQNTSRRVSPFFSPPPLSDPLNFLDGADDNKVRRFREAELTHGRVAMVRMFEERKRQAEKAHLRDIETSVSGELRAQLCCQLHRRF